VTSEVSPSRADAAIAIAAVDFIADPSGALYWPDERMLVVADLHLEKGSSYAARGTLLPPYDTAATLDRLRATLARFMPRVVVALGDSFHDGSGPERLADEDRVVLSTLQRGRDWFWIAGNHDPDPAGDIGGIFADALACGPLTLRHQPTPGTDAGEVAGHLHPAARVVQRGRAVTRRCFVSDGRRLVMPAFGAYAGGLSIRDRAFLRIFGAPTFIAHLLGARRLYAFSAARCL
jgi:DNA ligase-associated metallophosphoesterase